jgi:phosphatidylglycerophosphate synthase
VFAAIACVALVKASHSTSPAVWLVVAAAGIQLRLLCNLLDGLLAIEGGLKSKTGELYNEIPDRVADVVILVGAGYALDPWGQVVGLGVVESTVTYDCIGPTLGWLSALLAVLTAYVRLLGGSLGLVQSFSGPMAKQHRMFTLTVGVLASAVEVSLRGSMRALAIALGAIVVGSAVTLVLRTRRIARQLSAR